VQKTTAETPHRNVLHLRLDEQLRARLQEAADAHRFPLIREIRHRLLDSFDTANKRRFENIAEDIEINLLRLGALVVQMDLGRQLADAVANDESPKKIKDLARLITATSRRTVEK
jgi:hypothetical protein